LHLLREYRKSDLLAMVAMDAVCFTAEFLFDLPTMIRFAEARNAITIVAETEEDGLLSGFVIAHLERVTAGVRGYVATLDVGPEYRRTGLAERLMQTAEEAVAAEGAGWMDLHVFIENPGAIRLYERCGYVRGEVVANYFGQGLDAYEYRKAFATV